MADYEFPVPGLAQAVETCRLDAQHAGLASTVARFPGLQGATVRATRGGNGDIYLSRCKVLRGDGSVVHDDLEAWLAGQLQIDNGDAKATHARLAPQGYRLSRCGITKLYLASDRGDEDPANFVQIDVDLHDERVHCVLFRSHFFDEYRTLRDLVEYAEGDTVSVKERVPVHPPRYNLRRVVDVSRFVELAEHLEAQRRKALGARQYTVTCRDGSTETRSHADLHPGFDRYPSKNRRLFDDWRASSAGRSGARLCDHWLMQFSDWTDPGSGTRDLSLVPLWTATKKLAEGKDASGDVYGLFSKLQTLDRRGGGPFGWYFFMLHGNRVHDGAGQRVLKAAEDGLIVLPEHDYQVLRAWRDHNYGF